MDALVARREVANVHRLQGRVLVMMLSHWDPFRQSI
jgi:hypothetical protein